MKFGTAKATSMGMLLAALAIGVASALMFEEGSAAYTGSCVLILAIFVISLVIMFAWGRCPNCGKRLFYGLYKWKNCPKCRRKLENNAKYTAVKKIGKGL